MTDDDRAVVRNAADPDQVKKAGPKAKRRRERELADIRMILQSEEGKRFIWNLIRRCGVFEVNVDPTSRVYFHEGRREIGLKVLADVTEADPDTLVRMMYAANSPDE